MVVSLDNSASEVVKDICVDEGLHSLNSNFDHSAANGNHRDIMKEITDGAAAGITGDMESRSVNGPLDSNSGAEHFLSDSFSSGDKPKAAEEITGDICSGKISLKDLLSANDCASEPQKSSPISLNFSSSDRKRSFNSRTVEQDTVKEYYAVTSVASEAATLNQTSKIKESPTNGITKGSLEDRSGTITVFLNKNESSQSSAPSAHIANGSTLFEPVEANSYDDGVDIDDFNPRARETGGMDGGERTTKDSEQLNRAEKGPAVDGSKVDGATNSVRNSVHHYDGDMIMSGPIISSGPKASSGHIPYSGSISHRSDSSTTSTRSFAFPILQTEWNTSPVKMAKADRGRFRKHHGWRVGLFCCRF
ncbi:uncharacterized protein LOC109725996 [Ananas comosus]|uniref:Uncharacterized protein LOC109725996 n=1 Tax=Ananas comosus TaxID=4615 RepID=A0A6P5GT42_ANACO|nr:uncharacterized protein LOC109725996 [Ananas comosus]